MLDDEFTLYVKNVVKPLKQLNRYVDQQSNIAEINQLCKRFKQKNITVAEHLEQSTAISVDVEVSLQYDVTVLKKIKKKKITIDCTTDLHHKTLQEAEQVIKNTIVNSFMQHYRLILFIVGKGKLVNGVATGIINTNFVNIINTNNLATYIIFTTKALPMHGGEGSYYVYLKKNNS